MDWLNEENINCFFNKKIIYKVYVLFLATGLKKNILLHKIILLNKTKRLIIKPETRGASLPGQFWARPFIIQGMAFFPIITANFQLFNYSNFRGGFTA